MDLSSFLADTGELCLGWCVFSLEMPSSSRSSKWGRDDVRARTTPGTRGRMTNISRLVSTSFSRLSQLPVTGPTRWRISLSHASSCILSLPRSTSILTSSCRRAPRPTATVKDPNALNRGDPGYFDSIPDRSSSRFPSGPGGAGGYGRDAQGQGREELPLPTRPPFTAFVGNLAFETIEDDLQGYFEGLEVGPCRCLSLPPVVERWLLMPVTNLIMLFLFNLTGHTTDRLYQDHQGSR